MIKRHSLRDRQLNPYIARDEFRLLRILRDGGLPVPKPLHFDIDGEHSFLLTEFVVGAPHFSAGDLPSFAETLAEILHSIHRFDIARNDLSFLPRQRERVARYLRSNTEDTLGIRRTLLAALPEVDMNETALLHGDFWPGNLVWQRGKLAAIIDWEDAMLGDPLGDLGKSRLEMLWSLGEDAAQRYTDAYLARNSQQNVGALPYWELWGALRLSHFGNWAADKQSKLRMKRQYEAFVRAALDKLQTFHK